MRLADETYITSGRKRKRYRIKRVHGKYWMMWDNKRNRTAILPGRLHQDFCSEVAGKNFLKRTPVESYKHACVEVRLQPEWPPRLYYDKK